MDSWSTALLRWLRSHRDEARARLLRLAAASSAAALLLGLMQRRLALAAAAAPKIQDVPLSLVLDNVEAGRVHSTVPAAAFRPGLVVRDYTSIVCVFFVYVWTSLHQSYYNDSHSGSW